LAIASGAAALCGLSIARVNGHWTRGCSQQAYHRPNQPRQAFTLVSVHQTAPPRARLRTSDYCLLLIYRPRKDERLSWPSWLTCSGCFTHISGHHQLQVERRTGKARWPKTDVLCHAHCATQPTNSEALNRCSVCMKEGMLRPKFGLRTPTTFSFISNIRAQRHLTMCITIFLNFLQCDNSHNRCIYY